MSLKEESDRHAVNICNANVNEKYFKNFKDFPDDMAVVNYLFIPLFMLWGTCQVRRIMLSFTFSQGGSQCYSQISSKLHNLMEYAN